MLTSSGSCKSCAFGQEIMTSLGVRESWTVAVRLVPSSETGLPRVAPRWADWPTGPFAAAGTALAAFPVPSLPANPSLASRQSPPPTLAHSTSVPHRWQRRSHIAYVLLSLASSFVRTAAPTPAYRLFTPNPQGMQLTMRTAISLTQSEPGRGRTPGGHGRHGPVPCGLFLALDLVPQVSHSASTLITRVLYSPPSRSLLLHTPISYMQQQQSRLLCLCRCRRRRRCNRQPDICT